jgi:hypothetical protein
MILIYLIAILLAGAFLAWITGNIILCGHESFQ